MVASRVARGEIYLVSPAPHSAGRSGNPPLSGGFPDELNAHLQTFIVAPLTTGSHPYPFRIPCRLAGKSGHIVLDQLRTVDRARLVRRVARLSAPTLAKVLTGLQEMFAA